MSLVRGIAIATLLFLTSYLGTIFMQGPFFWLMFISPSAFRTWIDVTMNMWLKFTGAMLHRIGGIKVRLFGESIRPGERAILLLNHRTRLDFMYLWTGLSRFGTCYQEKIILKEGLDKIPGAGWAMQAAAFIFLTRKWQTDQSILDNYVKYFYKTGRKPHILIFPEGTDYCPNSKKRSDAYAEKNGLVKYEYVLHPRTTGFIHLLDRMQIEGGVEAIYDMTVGYPYEFPTSELQVACGKVPREVHYRIRRYDISKISGDNEVRVEWLTKLWADKEKELSEYYTSKKVFDNEIFPDLPLYVEAFLFIYWFAYIFLTIYYISTCCVIFVYFIFANLFCLYYSHFKGGFQKFYLKSVMSNDRHDA